MHSIVLEDNSNFLRYWIYTLIITTYRMNKRGFDCAPSRATSRTSFRRFSASLPHFPPFFPSILPRLLPLLFFLFYLFYLVPHQVSNYFPFAYILLTRLSSTLLHHEIQLRFIPPKLIFVLLESLARPKIKIAIYCMLHAHCTLHENMHRICGSLENMRWRRWFIFSPNRFHLSCPSSYKVPFSYISTMSSLNFLPRGLCRQNNESSCGANRRTRYDCWDRWV